MKVSIIGMGALGILYADHIKRQEGDDAVSFVMDAGRLIKYEGQTFQCNGREQTFRLTDCDRAKPADLVIVAVKYNGLASAVETMKNCVGDRTIIMSVMNGINSEDILARAYGSEKLVYTVAQGMDAMKAGSRLKYTRMGELRIGAREKIQQANVEKAAAYFERIGMPFQVDADIMHRIWGKYMLNVGVNQTCLAYKTTYQGVLEPGMPHDTMLAAMREVIALGRAEGVMLSEEDLEYYVGLIRQLDPDGYPSMAQDGVAKRYSEVEMFSGTVITMARKHGILVRENEKLYRMIKEMEADY